MTHQNNPAYDSAPQELIGWREDVALPDLGIAHLTAKIDSGAESAALHAVDISFTSSRGVSFVRFTLQLQQDDREVAKRQCEATLSDWRLVKSSNGEEERRPMIRTALQLCSQCWMIDVTLTNRDSMRHRLLLGRAALGERFLIDPSREFLLSNQTKEASLTFPPAFLSR